MDKFYIYETKDEQWNTRKYVNVAFTRLSADKMADEYKKKHNCNTMLNTGIMKLLSVSDIESIINTEDIDKLLAYRDLVYKVEFAKFKTGIKDETYLREHYKLDELDLKDIVFDESNKPVNTDEDTGMFDDEDADDYDYSVEACKKYSVVDDYERDIIAVEGTPVTCDNAEELIDKGLLQDTNQPVTDDTDNIIIDEEPKDTVEVSQDAKLLAIKESVESIPYEPDVLPQTEPKNISETKIDIIGKEYTIKEAMLEDGCDYVLDFQEMEMNFGDNLSRSWRAKTIRNMIVQAYMHECGFYSDDVIPEELGLYFGIMIPKIFVAIRDVNKHGMTSMVGSSLNIYILGQGYSISFIHGYDVKPETEIRTLGFTNFDTREIMIDVSVGDRCLQDTLCHELTHAFLFESGNKLADCEAVAVFFGRHLLHMIDIMEELDMIYGDFVSSKDTEMHCNPVLDIDYIIEN